MRQKEALVFYQVNTLSVITARVSIEGSSAVYGLCVDKDGVDVVAFSNVYDTGNIEHRGIARAF
jgi:hypothetical protein